MARKQSGKPPHKVGDKPGLRFKFGETAQEIRIGPDITVTICKEAGHLISYTKAPKELSIVVTEVEYTCETRRNRDNC